MERRSRSVRSWPAGMLMQRPSPVRRRRDQAELGRRCRVEVGELEGWKRERGGKARSRFGWRVMEHVVLLVQG